MSHEIEQPIDRVLSTRGAEWHGLAEHLETIDKETIRQKGLFFPIGKSQVVNWHGENAMQESIASLETLLTTPGTTKAGILKAFQEYSRNLAFIGTHQSVTADLTDCRPDLVEAGEETRIPLGIPKNSYEIITNEEAFDVVGRVFPNCNVTTAGTLRGAKVFFLSLDMDGKTEYTGPRGDKYLQFWDIVTSHDGTIAFRVYDSGTRIVCMNTLRASLSNKGDLNMVVYHSKNAKEALNRVSVNLSELVAGREAYFDSLGYLDTVSCSIEDARYLASAFLNNRGSKEGEEPKELSTQIFNRAEEIGNLFKTGQGNRGANYYDLLNGVTECFTWGMGTGAKLSKAEKLMKSRDGTAAEIKEEFYNFLLSGTDILEKARLQGEKLFREKEIAKAGK